MKIILAIPRNILYYGWRDIIIIKKVVQQMCLGVKVPSFLLTLKSQIKFLILLTVNHTILIILVQRI